MKDTLNSKVALIKNPIIFSSKDFCLFVRISLTNKSIEFFILRKLYIDLGMVLGYFTALPPLGARAAAASKIERYLFYNLIRRKQNFPRIIKRSKIMKFK